MAESVRRIFRFVGSEMFASYSILSIYIIYIILHHYEVQQDPHTFNSFLNY